MTSVTSELSKRKLSTRIYGCDNSGSKAEATIDVSQSEPKITLAGVKTPLSGVAERESQQERSELLNSGCPIESNASSPSQLYREK